MPDATDGTTEGTTDGTTDPSAAIQSIRDRAGIVAKLGPPRPGGDLINAAHRSAADVPALLKAVEAALKRHVEAVIEDMPEPRFRYCSTCSGHPAWPCPEVADITAALAGKEAGDAAT